MLSALIKRTISFSLRWLHQKSIKRQQKKKYNFNLALARETLSFGEIIQLMLIYREPAAKKLRNNKIHRFLFTQKAFRSYCKSLLGEKQLVLKSFKYSGGGGKKIMKN